MANVTIVVKTVPEPEQRVGPCIVCPHCGRVHPKGVVICKPQRKAIEKNLAPAFKKMEETTKKKKRDKKKKR